ncbi:hypothetical protein CONPUDRAFT_167932 [Coniophora puteana RWD-64-598 SS2]|uniref:Uncharacterized protein n=1 Tax=Coniophora puteana (strain RWD-64-598) TaxID=741705 RepID=A0A5M3MFK8_CONPW|nr:uncharacterized protein CONPUDRAFT_167932 [Coniophora puteana RWD-64-598 SS2]EIW77943.1 hypothetical protein CONPUDRAFT_167932 [Coniophora puteana RWD-64-598 SS2]
MYIFVSSPSQLPHVAPMPCLARNMLAANIFSIEGLVTELGNDPDAKASRTIPAKIMQIQTALGDFKSKVMDPSPTLLTETSEARRARIMAGVMERAGESDTTNAHQSFHWSLAVSSISLASMANAVSSTSISAVASPSLVSMKQDATTTPAEQPASPSLGKTQNGSTTTNVSDDAAHVGIDSLVKPPSALPASFPDVALITEESSKNVNASMSSIAVNDLIPSETQSSYQSCNTRFEDVSYDGEEEYGEDSYVESQWSGFGIDDKLVINLCTGNAEDETPGKVASCFLYASKSESAISSQTRENSAAISISVSTSFLYASSSPTRAPAPDVILAWVKQAASLEVRFKHHAHIVQCTSIKSFHGELHLAEEGGLPLFNVDNILPVASKKRIAIMSFSKSAPCMSLTPPASYGDLPTSRSDPTGLSLQISVTLELLPSATSRNEDNTKRASSVLPSRHSPERPHSSVHTDIFTPDVVEDAADKSKVESPAPDATPAKSTIVAASNPATITPSTLGLSFMTFNSPISPFNATSSTQSTPSAPSSPPPTTPSPALKRSIKPLIFARTLNADASPRSPSSFFKFKSESIRSFFSPSSSTKTDITRTKSGRVSSLRSLFTPSKAKDTLFSPVDAPRWSADSGCSSPSSCSSPETPVNRARARSRLILSRNKPTLSSKLPFFKRSVVRS